jgi:glutamate racemase
LDPLPAVDQRLSEASGSALEWYSPGLPVPGPWPSGDFKLEKANGIGIFDSGLGGLTVVHAIREQLPSESLIFLGDTARVPYGTRSPETVKLYARNCARRLSAFKIKLLVVACNTVSAVALDMLRHELNLPVLGVIDPGARAGVCLSESGRIGVIATQGTVASGAYERAIARANPDAQVTVAAAPLLVPLAEEGWTQGTVPELIVRHYLGPMVEASIDVLVLGCTHYPLLRDVVQAQLEALRGQPVPVVDSARATAQDLAVLLAKKDLLAKSSGRGQLKLLATDMPAKFAELASRFLGEQIVPGSIDQIDL